VPAFFNFLDDLGDEGVEIPGGLGVSMPPESARRSANARKWSGVTQLAKRDGPAPVSTARARQV